MNTDKFEWTDDLVREYVDSLIPPLEQIGRGLLNNAIIGNKIEQFKASKQRKPLLITEDGIPQYKEDRPWYVRKDFTSGGSADLKGNILFHPAKEYIYFSTEEKRDSYIIENKPCLSLKEIRDKFSLSKVEEQRLVEMIKAKIGGL